MADAKTDWRSIFTIHPCADVFPMLSDAELEALAQDIRADRLRQPVVLWREKDTDRCFVLDGRNRLEALARLV